MLGLSLAATVALSSALTVNKDVAIGFKAEINLETVGDIGVFELTGANTAAKAVAGNNPVHVIYGFETEELSPAEMNVTGSDPFAVPSFVTACPADAADSLESIAWGTYVATSEATDGEYVLACTPTTAQDSIFVTYELSTGPVSSIDNNIMASALYYMDGLNMRFVPIEVTKDNEAFLYYDDVSTEGPLFPSIYYPNIASKPWVRVELDVAASAASTEIAFCVTTEPIVEGDGYTYDMCVAQSAYANATVALIKSTTAGEDYSSGGLLQGIQSFASSTEWYITPFVVSGATSLGDFNVATADGHEPDSAGGLAPSMALFALVAAVAKYLQ